MTADAFFAEMKQNWVDLIQRFGVDKKAAKKEFKVIRTLMAGASRYYHTLSHVKALLDLIEEHEDKIENPDLLRWVAWYHDIVYDSTKTDNERVSAAYAVEVMMEMGLDTKLVSAVEDLILRTETHDAKEASPDEALFLDFDLGILGTSPERYKQYAKEIRAEYAWVTLSPYLNGRTQVLQKFLSRTSIYTTKLGQKLWETNARRNIVWELDWLATEPKELEELFG